MSKELVARISQIEKRLDKLETAKARRSSIEVFAAFLGTEYASQRPHIEDLDKLMALRLAPEEKPDVMLAIGMSGGKVRSEYTGFNTRRWYVEWK